MPAQLGQPQARRRPPRPPPHRPGPRALLDRVVGEFFADRVFGPGRAALLAAQLPATDAAAAADRDAQDAALKARIGRIETAQNAKILELEDLPANPDDPAGQAYRARIRARFAELHEERERLEAQLKTLAKTTPAAADPTLLDRLPGRRRPAPPLPGSRPGCSRPSTSPSYGTNPPAGHRHRVIAEATLQPSTPSSTPDKTATTTPPMTSPNR